MVAIYYFLYVPEDIEEMCEAYSMCDDKVPQGMYWSEKRKECIFINVRAFKQPDSSLIKTIIHEELHRILKNIPSKNPEWPMEVLGLA
jgi:hypothetical protein